MTRIELGDLFTRIVQNEIHGDLSARQIGLLCHVCINGAINIRDIVDHFNIGKPSISRSADKLQEQSLITRETDPMDRRSVILRATRAGYHYISTISGEAR